MQQVQLKENKSKMIGRKWTVYIAHNKAWLAVLILVLEGEKFRRKMIKGYIIAKGGYWVGEIGLIMPRICNISVPPTSLWCIDITRDSKYMRHVPFHPNLDLYKCRAQNPSPRPQLLIGQLSSQRNAEDIYWLHWPDSYTMPDSVSCVLNSCQQDRGWCWLVKSLKFKRM